MTSFLVSASTGVMNSLLCKLGTLLSDEYKLLNGVRKEIGILRDELSSMNSLLQKLAEADELDVQEKEWRNKVRELAYDIEDCIDIFMHQLCCSDGKVGFIRKAIRKIRKLCARHQIAVQIQELKSRVMEESARRDRYNIDVPTSSRRFVDIDPRLPALYTEAQSLVGISSPRDEIIHWLTDKNWKCCLAQQVNVVSIVGFGGLGKTTLARQVYYQIKDRFECAAFVSVSQTPDVSMILNDLLSQVGPGRTRICNNKKKLIEKIREELTHKSYLVVVDDIWSIQVWDIIKCAFVRSNGSRVIITTRIEQVAVTCCSYCHNHVYKMMPLNDHDSRRLFFRRTFGSDDACPEQYKNVSQKILRKCGGVPLVIISIASLLASQECMQTEKWENMQNFLMFELETSPTLGWMRHVLNLSYKDLPNPLKTCFLYLAVYPEDYKIEKVNLLRRWIAEGFISCKYGLGPEEMAESFFNELVNRNMIQPAGFDYGELTYCQVHDVMLDFILSKSIEENFITMIDEQRSTKGTFEVRRLGLQFKSAYLFPANMNLAQIRSLSIFAFDGSMNYLSRFELLRVLDLYCDKFDETQCLDCSIIFRLFQLRYFRITGYQLKLNHIGELSHLETLDIGDAIVSRIPSDIVHLKSLRHLIIPTDAKLPKGIGRMDALHALGFFNLRENPVDNIRDLGELTNLRDLDLIWTKQIMEAQDPSEKLKFNFLVSSLGKLTNLRALHFSSFDRKLISPKYDLLSCWFPAPCNLQRLSLSFCTFPKIPDWISQINKLTSLKIKVQELPRYGVELLGELPCLSYLDLSASEEPTDDIIFRNNTYPRLREFGFAYTFSSVTFEPLTMAKLQVLHLTFHMCGKERASSSLTGIEHLLNIEQLTARIYNCGNIGASFRDAILRHPRSHSFNILFPRVKLGKN